LIGNAAFVDLIASSSSSDGATGCIKNNKCEKKSVFDLSVQLGIQNEYSPALKHFVWAG